MVTGTEVEEGTDEVMVLLLTIEIVEEVAEEVTTVEEIEEAEVVEEARGVDEELDEELEATTELEIPN